jgi:putative transposase
MKSDEAKRLKALEDENRRLKELVADFTLDDKMLTHLSERSW